MCGGASMNQSSFHPSSRGQGAVLMLPVLILFVGCSKQVQTGGEVKRPVKTMIVAKGGEPRVRVFPGRVEASKNVQLAFQVAGLLEKLPVKEGQAVTEGDLIAQLRQDEFEARLKAVKGQLDQARAVLKAKESGERPEQVLRLEAALRAADARMNFARTDFQRIEGL